MTRRLIPMILALALLAFGAHTAVGAPSGAPTGTTAIALSGSVELAWQPVSGADHYTVLRGTSPTAVTTQLTPAGGITATTYRDTTAANGTNYYYAVRGVGGGVDGPVGNVVRAVPRQTCSGANPIVAENCFPGTTAWSTSDTGPASQNGIEGFANQSSIEAGQSVALKVNTGGAAAYDIEIYRTGDYGGDQGRLVSAIPGLTGIAQPACATTANTGLLDCSNWTASYTLTTTSAWQSGVYIIKLIRANGSDNQIILTVRNDGASADVLYLVPDTTYQAYNNYGGKSLYDFNSSGSNTLAGTARAVKVSFDRPYRQVWSGQRDWYGYSDLRMVSWLESQGYDVTYAAASDLERDPSTALGFSSVVSGGHDEYYSTAMRSALRGARDAGGSLFFSGANAIYWQIAFEAGPLTSTPYRVVRTYKTVQSGPADPQGPTSTWRDPAGANQPENGLIGVMYVGDSDFTYYPLRVSAAQGQDPVWRHTSVADLPAGTTQDIGQGIVGWEWDARVVNGAEPAGVTTLAASPVSGNLIQNNGAFVQPGSTVVNVTKYAAASGALVFATGTNYWNRGLGWDEVGDGEPNADIQQATVNVLSDMGALPATPSSGIVLDANGPPQVILTSPGNGATGVIRTVSPVATFSRDMNPSTLTTSSVTLSPQGGSALAATVTYNAATRRVTIDPTSDLAYATNYTGRITTDARATDGTALPSTVTWSFTTEAPPPPPTVTVTSPAGGATDVNPGAPVAATFSRAMDPATVTTATMRLTRTSDGQAVAGTVAYDAADTRATFTPSAALALNTDYTLTLTTGIRAADGIALASQVTRTFTTWTTAPPPPTVTATNPVEGATGVAVTTAPTATFSRDMDASTITGTSLTLTPAGGQAVAAAVTYDAAARVATLTPAAPLETSTPYTLALTTAIRAADGTPLAAAVSRTFTSNASACPCQLFPNTATPTAAVNPVQDGRGGSGPFTYEMGVKLNATQGGEIRSVRYYKSPGETGTHVGRVWSATGTQLAQVTFADETASGWQTQALATPVPIAEGATYTVSVNRNDYYPLTTGGLAAAVTAGPVTTVTGANGVFGNTAGTFPTNSWQSSNYFVDAVVMDDGAPPPPPSVTARTPGAGATGVAVGTSVTATFSRSMNASTITAANATIRPQGDPTIAATVTFDAANRRVTIDPAADLEPSTIYDVTLSTAIQAGDGTPLAAAVTWSFTTEAAQSGDPSSQLFADTVVPSSLANPVQDGRGGSGPFSYEMGVKVTATADAEIRGVRFFKSPGETGTHVGRVWSSTGTQLAQVTFSNESASGWQTQQLVTPVLIAGGTTVIVSVNRNDVYGFTENGLGTAVTAGPVATVVGANGVYGASAGVFPNGSYNNSNYFTDLLVAPATEPPPPPSPPQVTATSPVAGATNVPLTSVMSAAFSRDMDPATVTLSLTAPGGASVPGTTTYEPINRVATFTPDAQLQPTSSYTLRVPTSNRSADGVNVATAITRTFTTSASACPCQLFANTVVPESNANPVADGRTGTNLTYEMGVKITTALPSEITHIRFYKSPGETGTHVGRVWNADGTQLGEVTFQGEGTSGWQTQALATPLAIAANQVYTVSVNRNDYYAYEGGGLAQGVSAGPLSTVVGGNGVFNEAAGNFPGGSYGDSNYFVDLVVRDDDGSGGQPNPPAAPTVTGTTPAAAATSVPVDVLPTATFSREMDAATLTAANVTIQATNGPVLSAALTYDAASNRLTMNPSANLSNNRTYRVTIGVGATSADGAALAEPVSWTFTTAPATPAVTATTPADGANGVARNVSPTITFSRPMNAATMTAANITMRTQAGASVASAITFDAATNRVTIDPTADLAEGTTYVAQASTAVASADGAPLAAAFSFTFTTVQPPPTVATTTPADLATGVAVDASPTATFSRAMTAASITDSATIRPQGGSSVAAAVTYDAAANRVTVDPTADLQNAQTYEVTLAGTITAADGVAMAAPVTFSFTTVTATPPPGPFAAVSGQLVVEAESFANNITRSSRTWTAGQSPTGFVNDALRVLPDSGSTWSASSSQSPEFNIPIRLGSGTIWYVWVRMNAPNTNGNLVHVGLDGSVGSLASNITTSTFGSWVWTRTRSGSSTNALVLGSSGDHTLNVYAGEDGVAIDRIILTTSSSFSPTGNGPAESARVDGTAPTVAGRFPSPNATGVPITSNVAALFSEAINPATVTPSTFTLVRVSNGSTVTATRTAGAGNTSFTLDPSSNLVANAEYRATLTASIADTAGNPLTQQVQWTFTTAP